MWGSAILIASSFVFLFILCVTRRNHIPRPKGPCLLDVHTVATINCRSSEPCWQCKNMQQCYSLNLWQICWMLMPAWISWSRLSRVMQLGSAIELNCSTAILKTMLPQRRPAPFDSDDWVESFPRIFGFFVEVFPCYLPILYGLMMIPTPLPAFYITVTVTETCSSHCGANGITNQSYNIQNSI